MKNKSVFIGGGFGLLSFLLIMLAFNNNLYAQIESAKYHYGSYEVEVSNELFTNDIIRKAELELVEYINAYPDNVARDKATLLMIDIDIKSGNYNIAVGLLTEFLANRPNSPFAPQAAIKRGYIHFENKNFRQAEYDFDQASKIAERHYAIRKDSIYKNMACAAIYWQGISIILQSRGKDAIALFERCTKDYPTDMYADDALFAKAMLREIEGEYKQAIDLYKTLATDYPKSNLFVVSRVHQANCLLILKQSAAALMILENAETALNHIRKQDATGLLYEEQNYPENINERILYLRAEAANTAGNYTKALTILQSFTETYSGSPMLNPVRLSMGFTLLNLKRYDEALTYYDLVINESKENETEPKDRALLFRAVTLKRIGNTEEARQELMALAAKPAYPYSGAALLELGQLYYEQADFTSAKRTLERARREAENGLEKERIHLLLASTYTQLGHWDNAAEEYALSKKNAKDAKLLTMPDKDLYISESAFGRGIALVNCRRGTEAVPELMQFLSTPYSKGKEDKALFWLAEAYYSSDMLQNAIENYRKLVDAYAASERREEALYSLGWCYFKQKRFAESSRIFEQLTREFPNSRFAIEVWTRQGDAYYVQKNYARAANAYRTASRLAPKTEEGQYAAFQLCDALYRQKKDEEAITELFNFVGKYNKSKYAANALYLIGWIRFQSGKYSEAIDNFNFMITSHPTSPLVTRAHYAIADSYYNLGQYESAIHSYKIIIEKHPADPLVPGAMHGIQYCLSALGKDDEAISMIDEYVSGNIASPFIEDFAYKKGDLYYQTGKYKDAVTEYETFVQKYPDSEKGAEALYFMGKSYDRMNEWPKALEVYNGIVKNYPESSYAASALLESGLVKMKQTKIMEADSIFAVLETMYPENESTAQGAFERAIIKIDQGDTTQAIKQYEKIATQFPANEYGMQSRFRLASYYYNKNMNDSARYHLSHLVNMENAPSLSAEAQYRIGMLYMRDKNYEKASESFSILAEKFPGMDDWYSYGLLGLGEAYSELNLTEKAMETYKVLIEWRPNDDFGNTAKERLVRLETMQDAQYNFDKK